MDYRDILCSNIKNHILNALEKKSLEATIKIDLEDLPLTEEIVSVYESIFANLDDEDIWISIHEMSKKYRVSDEELFEKYVDKLVDLCHENDKKPNNVRKIIIYNIKPITPKNIFTGMEGDQILQEIKILHEMVLQYEDLKRELENQKMELDDSKKKIKDNEELINRYKNASASANDRIEHLKSKNKHLEEERKNALIQLEEMKNDAQSSEEERHRLNMQVEKLEKDIANRENDISELIEDLEKNEIEIQKLENSNQEYQIKIEEKNDEIDMLNKELENKKKTTEKSRTKSVAELEKRWTRLYTTLDFDSTVYKDVVKNYEYNEFLDIEEKIKELDQTKDKRNISDNRGKVGGGRFHVGFSTRSGYPSRIFFRDLGGLTNGKTVIVTDIVKHNDPRYEELCK